MRSVLLIFRQCQIISRLERLMVTLLKWSPTGKPVVPKNHTHLGPWALKRFGAQALRLRWVIRR